MGAIVLGAGWIHRSVESHENFLFAKDTNHVNNLQLADTKVLQQEFSNHHYGQM